MAQTQPPLGQEGKGRHVQTLACGGWSSGTQGYGEASSWGEKRVPLGGGRGDAQSLCWWTPSLATPKEPLESPGPVPPPTPITRPQSPGCHSRFIVSNRAPAKLSQGPSQWPEGSRWRGGQELGDAEVQAWSPGLRIPSHLSGSKEHQFSQAQTIPWVVSG